MNKKLILTTAVIGAFGIATIGVNAQAVNLKFNEGNKQAVTSYENAEVIKFEDPELEAQVKDALQITGPVTTENILNLKGFAPTSKNISSLKGLEYALNLTNLQIFYGSYSDLTPLNNLPIKVLGVSYNENIDMDSILNLKYIESIAISGNKQLAPRLGELAKFSKLRQIVAANMELTDVSFLGEMKAMQRVDFSYNNITSIDNISMLPLVTDLRLSFNDIKTLDGIENFPSVTTLRLQDNRMLNDISALESLNKLENLFLLNTNLDDHSFDKISTKTSLKLLGISDINGHNSTNKITNVEFMAKFPNVEQFVADGLAIRDISTLSKTVKFYSVAYQDIKYEDTSISDLVKIDVKDKNGATPEIKLLTEGEIIYKDGETYIKWKNKGENKFTFTNNGENSKNFAGTVSQNVV